MKLRDSNVLDRPTDSGPSRITHSKIAASFASTSSTISSGAPSTLTADRASRSTDRTWSHRITPVVLIPVPESDTVNPWNRAKSPPLVIGTTRGTWVRRLKASEETTSTGRRPRCSCPRVGSSVTMYTSPCFTRVLDPQVYRQAIRGLPRGMEHSGRTGPRALPAYSVGGASVGERACHRRPRWLPSGQPPGASGRESPVGPPTSPIRRPFAI